MFLAKTGVVRVYYCHFLDLALLLGFPVYGDF
jgi:hypothetical protein